MTLSPPSHIAPISTDRVESEDKPVAYIPVETLKRLLEPYSGSWMRPVEPEPLPSNREIGVGIFCAVASVLFLFALSEMFR